jgi:actin-binding protein IPP
MTVPCCNHGVTACEDYIYALGGWVGSEIRSSIERYTPDFWEVYGTMPFARYGFGIVAHQGLFTL